MKLEVFGPRAGLADKPGSDLEGAGGSDAPSPLSAAGDDSLGSDGDCAANSPAAGSGERSAGGGPGAEAAGAAEAPPLLLAPLAAPAPAKPLRGPAAGAHLYCPVRLPDALLAASARAPGPHLPSRPETLLA